MRIVVSLLLVSGLAACDPAIPDSAAGVGFDDLGTTPSDPAPGQTINGDQLVPPAVVSSETAIPPQPTPLPATLSEPNAPGWNTATSIPAPQSATVAPLPPATTNDDIARETAAALAAAESNSGVAPLEASPSNPAPTIVSNAGISDENDFGAVSSRQTIESDAERIARNKEQFQVVQPTELPSRSGAGQPNIVQYALSTSNPKGERIYTRAGINMQARNQRNCAKFASADLAQINFLANGGPTRDRQALDPDGDGFACDWDPAPFRKVAGN
ncbi:MAG: hypothetical protein GJ676_07095 [Rhodobacteraceae bacterium]|nr:hypothetical protein [Paracoccaceae bacterium]